MNGINSNDAFRSQLSASEARRQIEAWLPQGTNLHVASAILQARGFRCEETSPREAWLCIYDTPAPMPPEKRIAAPTTPVVWFVTLESRDGTTVSTTKIARVPKDIGD